MLIYNTSFHVEGDAMIAPFRTYMFNVYLPAITKNGYAKNPRFVSLLTDIGEGLQGFAVMFDIDDVVKLKKWRKEVGDALMADFHRCFGEKVLTFSTAMKEIVSGV